MKQRHNAKEILGASQNDLCKVAITIETASSDLFRWMRYSATLQLANQ